MLYLHESLVAANNPELSAFCVEGNVFDGGLDTADDSSAPVKEAAKKAKKRSLYNAQEEMVKVMQLRREDKLKNKYEQRS
jgi:hypothetical protein